MTTVQNLIDGKLADSVSGAKMSLVDPATGNHLRHGAGIRRRGHRQGVCRCGAGVFGLETHHPVAPAEGAARLRRRGGEGR